MKLKQSSTTKRYGTQLTILSNGLDGLLRTTLGLRRTTSQQMISSPNTGPKHRLLIPLFAVLRERQFDSLSRTHFRMLLRNEVKLPLFFTLSCLAPLVFHLYEIFSKRIPF